MNRSQYTHILLFILIITGCNGASQDPISISSDQELPSKTPVVSQVNNQHLLGYYDIYFDIESAAFEAVFNRNASFTLNIVPFLNKMTIPMNGITFDQIVIHNDDPAFIGVDVEFSVHHPFPGYDQYNAYDLRSVVIGNGANVLTYDGLRTARHGTDLWMKNPDGYTRWMNPTEFTSELIFGYAPGGFQNLAGDAHLNPCKYYAKHLGDTENLWNFLTNENNWDGIFESGGGRMMELEFPLPPDGIGIMFGYAVIVAWEEQGPDGPFYPVHIEEVVAASVTQTPDVWYNDVDGSGGSLILDIDLFGWEYQPSTIKIESTVLDGVQEYDAPAIGTPVSEHVSSYHVEELAMELTSGNNHEAWIIAEYDAFDYSNGLTGIPHADGPLAAFFRYELVVGDTPGNHPPVCDLTSDPEVDYMGTLPVTITFDSNGSDPDPGDTLTYEWSENGVDWVPGISTYEVEYTTAGTYSIYVKVTDNHGASTECSINDFLVTEGPTAIASACTCLWIAPGESVTFSGAQSNSPNGLITTYEWDFDGDGEFDGSYTGPQENPTYQYDSAGEFDVNLKVTDELGYSDELDPSEYLTVHVGSWTPPLAVSEICPTIGFIEYAGDFIGSGSMGTINLYEWDFEGDCVWDYEHETIGDTTHAYDIPGIYDAILRVTGTGCDTASTEVRMIGPLGILENGNFWDGVTWDPWTHGHWTKPGPLVEEIIPDPVFKNIIRFYSGPTSDGNCTWIIQDTDYDVSDLESLYFNFFFYVNFDTLYGDGYMGGDPDIQVLIRYVDAASDEWEIWYGYDTSFDGTWQWDLDIPPPYNMPEYVIYHEQEVVDEDVWNERKTLDLLTLDPKPVKIIRTRVCARGWSFESFTTLPWYSTE